MGILANGIIFSLSLSLSRARAPSGLSYSPPPPPPPMPTPSPSLPPKTRFDIDFMRERRSSASEINARGPVFTRKYGG